MFTWWSWNWVSEEWDFRCGDISSLDPEWMWNHPEHQPLRNGGEVWSKGDKNKSRTRTREFENKLTQREFEKWVDEMDVRVWRE